MEHRKKKEKRNIVIPSSATVPCVLHLGAPHRPLKTVFCSTTLGSARGHRFNAQMPLVHSPLVSIRWTCYVDSWNCLFTRAVAKHTNGLPCKGSRGSASPQHTLHCGQRNKARGRLGRLYNLRQMCDVSWDISALR